MDLAKKKFVVEEGTLAAQDIQQLPTQNYHNPSLSEISRGMACIK